MTAKNMSEERRSEYEHACGRRGNCPMMQDSAVEEIAEKAAQKAIEKLTSHVYREVGKSVISKLFYFVGAAAIGLYLWLKSRGVI